MPISSVSISGTGNVARHLGNALFQKGIPITHVSGRTIPRAKELADTWNCSYSELKKELPASDLYLIAVKDDAIRETAMQIYTPDKLLVHTSGGVESSVLNFDGNQFGAIWPMQTFTKDNVIDFSNTLICVTGSGKEIDMSLAELFKKISDRVLIVNDDQRNRLHLAAVWIFNFTNFMYSIAYDLLKEADMQFDYFIPLLEENMQKLKTMTPAQLQTGPASRGDFATLYKHSKLLSEHPEWQQLYSRLSEGIIEKVINSKSIHE